MVDGYTFQKGSSSVTFGTRAELFDYMIEQGEFFLDGDTASQMLKHINRRLETTKKGNDKWINAKNKLQDNGVE